MNVGIFGGSFNPIHNGHLILAEYIREKANLDKIIFIPVGLPCHKENNLINSSLRLKLIEIAIENKTYFQVSDIEIKENKVNYTYDTLLKLKELYPNFNFVEIIGEDSAAYIHKWKNYSELIESTEIYVFRRANYSFKSQHKNIKLLDTPRIDISSTEIRKRLKEGRSISYLVPEKVEYILRREIKNL